jgi:hypothetical protein
MFLDMSLETANVEGFAQAGPKDYLSPLAQPAKDTNVDV